MQSFPQTLLLRTGFSIALSLLVFMLFASSVIYYYVLQPIGRQAAGDLAALVTHSAESWTRIELEVGNKDKTEFKTGLEKRLKAEFKEELQRMHGISLLTEAKDFFALNVNMPFMNFFQAALVKNLGKNISLLESRQPDRWIWIKVPQATEDLYIGFSHSRIGPRPPLALFFLLSGAAIITLITAILMVRYISRPLSSLAAATLEMGKGSLLSPLPEEGPQELALLARSFNQMAQQIQELLANRTTLLAGISHDLRTPISRIRIALELIENPKDESLVEGIEKDLHNMNQLISRTLELSQGFNKARQRVEKTPMQDFLNNIVLNYQNQAQFKINLQPNCEYSIPKLVVARILINLLENAIRYGQGKDITIACTHLCSGLQIAIIDQGPGIPEAQREAVFQPFYRLEGSRNSATGGCGLGLAIVRQLAHTYGWTVELKQAPTGGVCAILNIT